MKGDFQKAEICFLKGIKKGGNSSIHCEYGQALYLNKRFEEAIKQLSLSIEKCEDNFFSYFGEMEKNTVDDILVKEIDKFGTVRIKSSHLAYYLLLKITLELKDKEKYSYYFNEFVKIAKKQNDPLLNKLLQKIILRSKVFI